MPTVTQLDPDGPGGTGPFGLQMSLADSAVRLVGVPWQATASYGRGTHDGPRAVLAASVQIDLEDPDFGDAWRAGIAVADHGQRIAALDAQVEADALAVIDADGVLETPALVAAAARVNDASVRVNDWVAARTREILSAGAVPGVVGGDHSSPLGAIRAAAASVPGLGVLHIDAHADLRDGYLGFTFSHASIQHHALATDGVGGLVGVGYRDMGRAEVARIADDPRIVAFLDRDLQRRRLDGVPWRTIVGEILAALPPAVWISLDIDGLDPTLCPSTGTPVPGGLDFAQLRELLVAVAAERRIVGFDLSEVSPGAATSAPTRRDTWDAIVGARVLYKLCGAAIRSQQGPTG